MEGPLLPDEFPFTRRRVALPRGEAAMRRVEEPAPATAPTSPVADAAPAVAAPVAAETPVIQAPAPATAVEPVVAEAPAIAAPVIVAAAAVDPTPAPAPVAEVATPWQSIVPPTTPPQADAPAPAKAAPRVIVRPTTTKASAAVTTPHSNRAATSRATVLPAASVSDLSQKVAAAEELRAGYKGPERRRSPRQALRAKAIYRAEMNPAGAGPVQLVNVSLTGCRLFSTRAMKVGERAQVRMEIGPVKWFGRVKVVTCRSEDGEGFTVGCEFAGNEVTRRSAAA